MLYERHYKTPCRALSPIISAVRPVCELWATNFKQNLLIFPFSNNFWRVLLGLTTEQIHFVELVGDGTRTPVVQAVIKQIFEKETLQRTLNASECIARGASLNSAMMTPHFNVQTFTMNDYNNMPINVNYQFTDVVTNEAKEPKEYRNFFELGQKFPLVQQLKFDNKEGLLSLKIDYSD